MSTRKPATLGPLVTIDEALRTRETLLDDLSRDVYCILGVPVDAIEMPDVLRRIETAAASKVPFFISTPNLNFLVKSWSDEGFRDSLLLSDLCPADGMPIVWIAKLMGIPIKKRIAGSDIFDALKAAYPAKAPLKLFLFGAPEGAGEAAGHAINAAASGLHCRGTFYPGFGSIDDMSRADIIDTINASGADFLVVSLGAQKGQSWLVRNNARLRIPVRAHLGAVINFEADTIRRAPLFMQKAGLEWMWRVLEEPTLWKRYVMDGSVMLRLLITCVLPLVASSWLHGHEDRDLTVTRLDGEDCIRMSLHGPAIARHVEKMIPEFREAIATRKRIVLDLSDTSTVDARFLGLLLMLRKRLQAGATNLAFTGLTYSLDKIVRLNNLGFLLAPERTG
jgi:N-acetylglucosaminyldiphosphoundecaprenol N-acetyl-beta-D-mannosaminyltransferase